MSHNADPYNRTPSPHHASSSPYRTSSSLTVTHNLPPTDGGQIATGPHISHITTIHQSYNAVPASYQTANGMEWDPAEATKIPPSNTAPVNCGFQQTRQWGPDGDREHEREREWQREEDKHRKREGKDAACREKEHRKPEQAEDRDLLEARERDKQAQYQQSLHQQDPYRTGVGAGRVSPYSPPGALPNTIPPHQGGGGQGRRSVSPYQSAGALPSQPCYVCGQLPSQRPVSPCHGGGQLPTQRPVSPNHSGEALPSQRSVSPYHSGGALPSTNPVSPYHSGGALLSNKPISPHHGGENLTGTTSSTHYSNPNHGSTYNEVERKMDNLAIGGKASEHHSRKKSTGYQPAPGGDYPPGTPKGHYTTTTTTARQNPYNPTIPVQSQTATRNPYNRGPSPSPHSSGYQLPPQPQSEQGMLAPPEGFSRPPNAAQSYTQFDTFKIQDMDDLMENIPRMPAVLTTHDVYHQDWIRFMQDLSEAWLGRLPIPESAKQDGRPPKRKAMAIDLVQVWNESFFAPRGVELIIYKGREPRNGRYAGRIDTDLPDFNLTVDDITDSSDESTGPDSEDDYVPPGGVRYGNYGGVYGKQDPLTVEAHNAKLRRKEVEEHERRKRKEKEARRRVRELERIYALYLFCH